MKPDQAKIRQMEYDLGFEVRPGSAATALLKELYMQPRAQRAAELEIQDLVETNSADRAAGRIATPDADMTPREHLQEVKDLFVRGEISVEEAALLDRRWRLQMIEERRA